MRRLSYSSFGLTLVEWRAKLLSPEKVSIGAGSTLLLKGDLTGLVVESLTLEARAGDS